MAESTKTSAAVDALFDRSGTVARPSYAALLGEFWALATDRPKLPAATEFASGEGHHVLVLPAFLMGDAATKPLRRFLGACGYRAEPWQLGINWGPTHRIVAGLRLRLDALCAQEGGPVSVVGISLGGVLARDLAYDHPAKIRQVITLASPFQLPTASTIEPLYRLCALFASQEIDPTRLNNPLPVPSTAIFSPRDGVVAWQSCFTSAGDCFSVGVDGAHMTMGRNPAALRVMMKRLSTNAAAR